MQDIYRIRTSPQARQENMIAGETYRITVLTEGLIRLEYSGDGVFEDRATSFALHRDFPAADYRVVRKRTGIEIYTSRLHLLYDEKEFSPGGLSIQIQGGLTPYHSIWHYGDEIHDLGGTTSTLDEADGAVPLEKGVVSFFGFSLLDDSRSHIIREDGWIEPRKKGIQDLYFWGYGHDYRQAIGDLGRLCGSTPMLPRYALGNWWSRFYRYSEESYLALMDRFEKEGCPFTTAVLDMDWHLTRIDPKYGSGWTGYTWDRELFPEPARFLGSLHDRGMKVTLNIHPADGVREYEEMYEEMAAALGQDTENGDLVRCDLADPEYLEAYFKYLHHPREEEGVDFWWIDWQQGNLCRIEGLSPLWILNHYHSLDSRRQGKRSMLFSRYAGPGSHRYPAGFSGDTVISWKSLDFQPYFTVTASNIGYGWWSHDIGGHMQGYKDDELAARWVQFGVYSPIMRLHSSNNEFSGKEPWRYRKNVAEVMKKMLRERHRMIPYLYTMNYRNYRENQPLLSPMYYNWAERREAYGVKNQYLFGTSLLVAPITEPADRKTHMAKVRVWLPEGVWYDIYTGMTYQGDREIHMYRGIESIPVLAPAGSILPFTDQISPREAGGNPESLHIMVYAGADGEFELYEDENDTCAYETGACCRTRMTYREREKAVFMIWPAAGDRSLIPDRRSYVVEMTGYQDAGKEVAVFIDGKQVDAETSYDTRKNALVIQIPPASVGDVIEISVELSRRGNDNCTEDRCYQLLDQAEIEFDRKDRLYSLIRSGHPLPVILSELGVMEPDPYLRGALTEILTANR